MEQLVRIGHCKFPCSLLIFFYGTVISISFLKEGTLTLDEKEINSSNIEKYREFTYHLIIKGSVTSIHNIRFSTWNHLLTVVFEDNDRASLTIGNYLFSGCAKLKSVVIGTNVNEIGEKAFFDCKNLSFVTIGESVKRIGYCAFYICIRLKNITIPNSVISIGKQLFMYCARLNKVIIGESVEKISEQAFYFCKELTNITIPNSVISIEFLSFANCFGLKTVIIGKNVKKIEKSAFGFCKNLKCVYFLGESEPKFNGNAFFGASKTILILTLETYQKMTFGGRNVIKGTTNNECIPITEITFSTMESNVLFKPGCSSTSYPTNESNIPFTNNKSNMLFTKNESNMSFRTYDPSMPFRTSDSF